MEEAGVGGWEWDGGLEKQKETSCRTSWTGKERVRQREGEREKGRASTNS